MPIQNIADSPPCTVAADSTVISAIEAMARDRVGACAVVDQEGKLLGIFTERDLMNRVVLARKNAEETSIDQVMTSPCTSVPGTLSEGDALQICAENHFRHLPIVDDAGSCAGMLSIRALMEAHAEQLARDLDSMANYMGADGPGG